MLQQTTRTANLYTAKFSPYPNLTTSEPTPMRTTLYTTPGHHPGRCMTHLDLVTGCEQGHTAKEFIYALLYHFWGFDLSPTNYLPHPYLVSNRHCYLILVQIPLHQEYHKLRHLHRQLHGRIWFLNRLLQIRTSLLHCFNCPTDPTNKPPATKTDGCWKHTFKTNYLL